MKHNDNRGLQVICRQCGSNDLKFRGAMTQADTFCGMPLPNDWYSGALYECRNCHRPFGTLCVSKANI